MKKPKGKREPRPPSGLPATYDEARELEIINTMNGWHDRMVEALKRAGFWTDKAGDLNSPELGHRLYQEMFARDLATAKDPDIFATIRWLAEHGHVSARRALEDHATKLLEDGKADLPSSIRSYLVLAMKGRIPDHPEDKSEVIDRMFRDMAVRKRVDVAAARWGLPKRYSSRHRKSAAWFVAEVWTRRGIKLAEQQVRRIYSARNALADRMNKLFLAGAAEDPAF